MENMTAIKKRKVHRTREAPVTSEDAVQKARVLGLDVEEVKVALEAMRDAQRARTVGLAQLLESVGGYHRLD